MRTIKTDKFLSIFSALLLLCGFPLPSHGDVGNALSTLDEKITIGKLLIHLDEVDAFIDHPDRCGKKSARWRMLKGKLRRLNEERTQGRLSYPEYSARYDRIKQQEQAAKGRFDRCFTPQLRKLLKKYPDIAELGILTWTGLNEEYKRLRDRHFPIGLSRDSVERLIEQRSALDRRNARQVGILTYARGQVRVESYRLGDVILGEKGDPIHFGDIIQTGSGARARVEFLDSYVEDGSAVVNVGSDTKVGIKLVLSERAKKRPRLNLIQGWIRAFIKRIGSIQGAGSSRFSVRVSSVLCSTQGGEFEIRHDPAGRRTAYKVHQGSVYLVTPHEEKRVKAGGEVKVINGLILAPGKKPGGPPA